MQFKLLNFYKFVSCFATNLVGAFIPLIIYKSTASIRLAMLFIIAQSLCRLISNHVFKKLYYKNPQLSLLLRTIPLIIYNVFLVLLDKIMVLSIIIIAIAYGISLSFKNNVSEILLNYSSKEKSRKNLAKTRVIDSLSTIIASISGGLFIDWNKTLLIILSVGLYLISVCPLFIYFIKNRKTTGFNKDFISDAVIEYDKSKKLRKQKNNLIKSFIINYLLFYTLFCVVDQFTNMYNLRLFIEVPTFAKAGYITAIFHLAYTIGNLCVNYISKKVDLNFINVICAITTGITCLIMPFIQSYVLIYILLFIFGFAYSICSFFMMSSLMQKSRILGITNITLTVRQDGLMLGQILSALLVLCINTISPVFVFMLVGLIVYAIFSNIKEKQMCKDLVDYLNKNEIK